MFNIGDKVYVNNEIGHIEEVFDTNVGYIYIVQLSDKTLVKALAENLEAFEPEQDPETITINREDFRKAIMRATDPKRYKEASSSVIQVVTLTGILLGSELEKELFSND